MPYDLEIPEGMLGRMLSVEGVSDAATILHGPTGCKNYPADLSEKRFRFREGEYISRNPFVRDRRFYFYQPRIPCTYLDGDTYVSGAHERLEELYSIVVNDRPKLIGVVNSPGASLIGEDLSKLQSDIPTVVFESPGYSQTFGEGFQDGVIKILSTLGKSTGEKKGVYIFGMSTWQYRWEDSESEIRRILALCGIEDVTFVCAGSSAEKLSGVPDSLLNIVVYEEFGRKAAEFCKNNYGTEYMTGLPLGFGAVETWIRKICDRLGKDPSAALNDLSSWRHRSALKIARLDASYITIAGKTFSAEGDSETIAAITDFLYDYLGLVPVALSAGRNDASDLRNKYRSKGIPVSDSVWETEADMAFASGSTVISLKERGIVKDGIDIDEPSRSRVCITDHPFLGTLGTVLLLQETLDIATRVVRYA